MVRAVDVMNGALLLLGLLGLAACQQPGPVATPLEEARRTTAEFGAQGFVTPPRSVADITAILDQERPDPARAAANRAKADAPPPAPGSPNAVLARFYLDRGRAAGDIGRLQQQVTDLRQSVALYRAAGDTTNQGFQFALLQSAFAERGAGNLAAFNALRQERYALSQGTGAGLGDLTAFARFAAAIGDADAAEGYARDSDALLAELLDSGRRRNIEAFGPNWRRNNAATRAAAFLASGQLTQAEKFQRQAIGFAREATNGQARAASAGNAMSVSDLQLTEANERVVLSQLLQRQGRLVEAEAEVREALMMTLRAIGRDAPDTGRVLFRLGFIVLAQDRAGDAEKLGRAAIRIQQNLGADETSRFLNEARMVTASALVVQGQVPEAVALYDAVERAMADDTIFAQQGGIDTTPRIMALYRLGGRDSDALKSARRLATRNRQLYGERSYEAALARAFVAIGLARTGDQKGAWDEFRTALPDLIGSIAEEGTDEGATRLRERQFRFVLNDYLRFLSTPANRAMLAASGIDPAIEGFRAADAALGRSVQRALGANTGRIALADPALTELARREQDAGEQAATRLAALSNLLSLAPDQRDTFRVAALQREVDQLRQARAAIRGEIERRFPDYADLTNPKPASIDQVRKALAPDEALVATFVAPGRTYVWAVSKTGPVAFATTALGEDEVRRIVGRLRTALDPGSALLGDLPAFDVALSHELYGKTLGSVTDGWRDAKSLIVVPDRALAQLPFGVLVTQPATLAAERPGEALFQPYKAVPWLARDVAITNLPATSALVALRALPPGNPQRKAFLGFGDPVFSAQTAQVAVPEATLSVTRGGAPLRLRSAPPVEHMASAGIGALPRLPDTAEEVREIAATLKADPQADVLLGRAASERSVKTTRLSDRKVIAFATHGLVPGDLDGLTQPALALSAPQVTGDGEDGLLTMEEVLALKLDADWVVLSACNTAAGDGAGADALSGLGRAFFYAGTRALLASNWPVETTSARLLTTGLFKRQAEDPSLTRAEALRRTELDLIDGPGRIDPATGKVVFAFAHPIFWAPFALYGDGGR